jgi:hypothetical protein
MLAGALISLFGLISLCVFFHFQFACELLYRLKDAAASWFASANSISLFSRRFSFLYILRLPSSILLVGEKRALIPLLGLFRSASFFISNSLTGISVWIESCSSELVVSRISARTENFYRLWLLPLRGEAVSLG